MGERKGGKGVYSLCVYVDDESGAFGIMCGVLPGKCIMRATSDVPVYIKVGLLYVTYRARRVAGGEKRRSGICQCIVWKKVAVASIQRESYSGFSASEW